jgi:hypothetical protein
MLIQGRYKSVGILINPGAYPMGIQSAWCCNEPGNAGAAAAHKLVNFYDSVTHRAVGYTFNGNPLQIFNVLGSSGPCIYNNSGSGYGVYDVDQLVGVIDPKTWVYWGGTPSGLGSTLLGKSGNDANEFGWAFGINFTGGVGIAIEMTGNDVKWSSTTGGVGPWTECVHQFAFTWDGTLTAANQKIMVDGVVQPHSFDQNGTGSHGTDAAQILLLGIARNGPQYGGSNAITESFFLFNRPLAVAELQELYVAPYRYHTSQLDRMISSGAGIFVNWFNSPVKVI